MQSDRDALLAGILADPDADLPRLVFADWLEETGHPANCARAEYIRLAIELGEEVLGNGIHRQRTDARLTQLKEMFEDELSLLTPTFGIPGAGGVSYSRGFAESVHCKTTFLSGFLELIPRHPVRALHVLGSCSPNYLLQPLILPPSLQRLHCGHAPGRSLMQALFSQSKLPRIREVEFDLCNFMDEDIIRLIGMIRGNQDLHRLEVLSLKRNRLTDHAAHTLAAANWPPTFRSLNIDGTRITNAGREVLFRRFGFEELRPRLALS